MNKYNERSVYPIAPWPDVSRSLRRSKHVGIPHLCAFRPDGANQGNVVGMAAATLADGQNLNFAIPVSYLRRILAEPLRQVTPLNATESSSGQSVLGRIGKSGNQGVIGRKREWSNTWDITLTLANQLNDPVKDVRCLFVFYDGSREPIDFVEGYFRDVIPPGLAKRVEQSTYRRSEDMSALYGLSRLVQTLEIRVLDFQIVKDQKKAQSPLKFSQFRVCNILEDARQLKVTSSFLREDARLPLHSRLRYASRCASLQLRARFSA